MTADSSRRCDSPTDDAPAAAVRRVGIVGAGMMGRAIALVNLERGSDVRLHDADAAARDSAGNWIAARQAELRPPGSGRGCLYITGELTEAAAADLVIESVVENRAVKRRLLKSLSLLAPADSILATNTSSLSIGELAGSVSHPERFCGLHFCHPVLERPLVEIVRGPHSTEGCLRRAESYVAGLGRPSIVTADTPGFAVNALLFPYLDAAIDLLRAGVDWEQIESAAESVGMPQGPLSQMDDIGIPVILRAAAALHRTTVTVPPKSEVLLALYQAGRLGRRSGAGFFRYEGGQRSGDEEARRLLSPHRAPRRACPQQALTLPLFVPMLSAGIRLIEQGTVRTRGDVERALADGLGARPPLAELFAWGAALDSDRYHGDLNVCGLSPPEALDRWWPDIAAMGTVDPGQDRAR